MVNSGKDKDDFLPMPQVGKNEMTFLCFTLFYATMRSADELFKYRNC